MEDEWTQELTSLLDIARDDLPMIWDADFMLGPVQADGSDSYVLGEINVSSVHPYPGEAPAEIARRVADRLQHKLYRMLTVSGLKRLHIFVSFDLQDGECVALQGPSGVGKTLLLRSIANLDPNEGTVKLDGTLREAMPAPAWRKR